MAIRSGMEYCLDWYLTLEQSLVLGRKQFSVHKCFHDDNYLSMILQSVNVHQSVVPS
jgi:hypothetical protein